MGVALFYVNRYMPFIDLCLMGHSTFHCSTVAICLASLIISTAQMQRSTAKVQVFAHFSAALVTKLLEDV